jgi:hypothetical protein
MQRRKTIGNSFGFIEASESRLRRDTDALNYLNEPYSPKCVEGVFSEVELPFYGVLRSSLVRYSRKFGGLASISMAFSRLS